MRQQAMKFEFAALIALANFKYTKGLRGSGSATPAGMGLINLAGL